MKIKTFAILLALVIPSARAAAQRDDQFTFGIGGGASIVSGEAADAHKTGAHGTVSWGIGMVDSPWGIRFDGMYSALGAKERLANTPNAQTVMPQGDARVFVLTGNAVVTLYGSNTHLYAIGGLGGFWYNPDGDGTKSQNNLALQGGLGVYLPVANAFIEAKWLRLARALPDQATGLQGKKTAILYPVTLGILF